MKKPNLKEWAAIFEIFSAIAVIVSLVFVVIGLNRNTVTLEAVNEDFTYDLYDRFLSDQVNNPALFETRRKIRDGEPVSDAELRQLDSQRERYIANWERLYVRHVGGLMSDSALAGWDTAGRAWLKENMTQETWETWKGTGYRADFEAHIDGIYAEFNLY